jgi:pimeloyl-ACP methyl ester carboxylesterase
MPVEPSAHSRLIQTLLDRHAIDLDVQSAFFGYDLLTTVAELVCRNEELPNELFEMLGPQLGKHPRRTAKRWLDLVERAHHELVADDGLTPATLRSFRFPMMAMFGERSRACATGEFLRNLWPHADFRTVPDAGHFFPSSRASEVISACDEFWDAQLDIASNVA